jgi:hypothetical protein
VIAFLLSFSLSGVGETAVVVSDIKVIYPHLNPLPNKGEEEEISGDGLFNFSRGASSVAAETAASTGEPFVVSAISKIVELLMG